MNFFFWYYSDLQHGCINWVVVSTSIKSELYRLSLLGGGIQKYKSITGKVVLAILLVKVASKKLKVSCG